MHDFHLLSILLFAVKMRQVLSSWIQTDLEATKFLLTRQAGAGVGVYGPPSRNDRLHIPVHTQSVKNIVFNITVRQFWLRVF